MGRYIMEFKSYNKHINLIALQGEDIFFHSEQNTALQPDEAKKNMLKYVNDLNCAESVNHIVNTFGEHLDFIFEHKHMKKGLKNALKVVKKEMGIEMQPTVSLKQKLKTESKKLK